MSNNPIGVIVSQLENSQLCYSLIRNINQYRLKNPNQQFYIFTNNHGAMPIKPLCPVMFINEAYSFLGPLISTNVFTTFQMVNCIGKVPKYFYVWDLEWFRMNHQEKQYDNLVSIYRNPNIKLITRSNDYKHLIETCWNKPVSHVLDNFNIEELVDVVHL